MKTRISAVLLAVAFAVSQEARASTMVWTNTSGGNWSDAGNWSPNQVPGAADTAQITTSGTCPVRTIEQPALAQRRRATV